MKGTRYLSRMRSDKDLTAISHSTSHVLNVGNLLGRTGLAKTIAMPTLSIMRGIPLVRIATGRHFHLTHTIPTTSVPLKGIYKTEQSFPDLEIRPLPFNAKHAITTNAKLVVSS